MIAANRILSPSGLRRWATDELSLAERVLVAMRHFDWVSSGDLFDGMNLDEALRKDASSHISRMVKRGLIETDRTAWPPLYRLSGKRGGR